jgi:hypothetical protein
MIERIFQIIEYKGINKSVFYKSTGLSNGFLDKVKDIGVSKLEQILNAYPDINMEWLLTGKGEMLKSELPVVKTNETELDYLKKINELQEYKIKQLEEENSRFETNIEFVKKNN